MTNTKKKAVRAQPGRTMVTHKLNGGGGPLAYVKVPDDLSQAEAEFLASWVKLLVRPVQVNLPGGA